MPKKARRRKAPADLVFDDPPLSTDDMHAIAAYCGYVLVTSRHHTALVDVRTGKTCLRGCDAVIGHLRDLVNARPCKAELAALDGAA
jgi:hypothetical protein